MTSARLVRLCRRSSLVRYALYNYLLHFSRYILPLFMLPYLSRVLQPDAYGLVFIVISFASMLSLLIEFGFSLSANRELAGFRDDNRATARLVANVSAAKVLLALVTLIIGVIAILLVPRFQANPAFACWGIVYAIVTGMSPMWYYQANERMRVQSSLEIGGQVMAVILTFTMVHSPEGALEVIIFQSAGALLSTGSGYFLLYRDVPFVWPTLRGAWFAVKLGWTMFLFKGFVMLYTTVNVFLVGLYFPPNQAAYYGVAEKIYNALSGLLAPFAQTMFPRINYLLVNNPAKAPKLVKTGLLLVSIGSTVAVFVAWLLSPLAMHIFFGDAFAPSGPVFNVLILALPLVGINGVLGLQCMLPLRMDRTFNLIICSTGLLNLLLATTFVPSHGISAMAWIKVFCEGVVVVAMAFSLWLARAHIAARIKRKAGSERLDSEISFLNSQNH